MHEHARRDLRRALGILAAATLVGVLHLVGRGIPLVGDKPDPNDSACGSDEDVLALVERVSVAEAQGLLEEGGVTFVDARSADAYVLAHVPGAISLPAEDAAGILQVQSVPIPPEDLVVTYCDGGKCERSEYLGLLLRDEEICQQVRVLEGGWLAWAEAGAPTEGGAPE